MKIAFDYTGLFYLTKTDFLLHTKLDKVSFSEFFDNLDLPEYHIRYDIYTDCSISECKDLIKRFGAIERI